jgi:hypothetical protein
MRRFKAFGAVAGWSVAVFAALAAGAQTTPTLLWATPPADVFPTPLTALQLNAVALAGPPVQVSLPFNLPAIEINGQPFASNSGIDGDGNAFPGSLVPSSLMWDGVTFSLGAAGANNAVANATITVPQGNYSSLMMLANMVNNVSPSATFTVTYTDGTTVPTTLSMSDWVNIFSNPGESRVACWPYRLVYNGGINNDSVCLDGYQIPLDPTKVLATVTTPTSKNYVVEAMVLLPVMAPGTLNYSPPAGTVTPIGTNALNTVFLPTSTTAYNSANASVSLVTVPPPSKIQTQIVWPSPAPITYAAPLTATQLDAQGVAPYSAVPVSLGEDFSVDVIFPDGTSFGRGGFDSTGDVYSANALGTSVIYDGNIFSFGPVAVPDAVTSQTIPLAAGSYSELYLIGAASNAAQPAQSFTVTYSDGTTTTAQISMSTWRTPQNYAGETTVETMSYALNSAGGKVQGAYFLYGYGMALDPTKSVVSLTLPSNSDVKILAAALVMGQTISIPGSYVYTPPAGTILSAGPNQLLSVAFSPNDTATYTNSTGTTTLTVLPAPLIVEADNKTRPYGTPNPLLTGSITGAVNGDVFTESISTTAAATSNVGTYAITPVASGTNLADYVQTIDAGTLTITQVPVTMTLAASATTVMSGGNVTLTAVVVSTTTGTPTGTVTFASNGGVIGSATLINGTATFATTLLPTGTDNITASYSGDINFLALANAANTVNVTVQVLDFTLMAPNGTTLTTLYGGHPTLLLHVAPVSGLYGSDVVFTLTGQLPPPSWATVVSFSPSTVGINAGPADVTLTIATDRSSNDGMGWRVPEGVVLALLLIPLFGRRRRKLQTLGVVLALGLLSSVSGCGTGYAARSFPLTVTATSAGIQHSVAIVLNMEAGPQ